MVLLEDSTLLWIGSVPPRLEELSMAIQTKYAEDPTGISLFHDTQKSQTGKLLAQRLGELKRRKRRRRRRRDSFLGVSLVRNAKQRLSLIRKSFFFLLSLTSCSHCVIGLAAKRSGQVFLVSYNVADDSPVTNQLVIKMLMRGLKEKHPAFATKSK